MLSAKPFGCDAGRRHRGHPAAVGQRLGDQAARDRGFAGAGAPGEDGDRATADQVEGLSLAFVER